MHKQITLVVTILPLPGGSKRASGPHSSSGVSKHPVDKSKLQGKQAAVSGGTEVTAEVSSQATGAGRISGGQESDSGILSCVPS